MLETGGRDSTFSIQHSAFNIQHSRTLSQGRQLWLNGHPPDPERTRRLLLHRREIEKLHAQVQEKGLTVVPLRLYFKGNRIKAEVAVVRGKKLHDKRETERRKEADREAAVAMKGRR
jgi:SsrA-binding protein